MRRSILLSLILTLMGCGCMMAQRTAADFFTEAPAKLFPLLDQNTRLDMVDYYKSNLATPSNNKLDGKSVITDMKPESVSVRMTPASSVQIAVLPASSDSVVMVISTVSTPGKDSSAAFYTTAWEEQPAEKYFSKPEWKDWIVKGGSVDEVTMQVPFMLASYVYDPATKTLTLTNNLETFLDETIYEMISPSLKKSLTYTWNGKKFTK